ncbi:uncharacterized protein [Panulirus ornatus]|uniref:uncharacterized protein n=1 Tax=Panulirus ornatus TaxID=150431 RepID=UPI003A8AEC3D
MRSAVLSLPAGLLLLLVVAPATAAPAAPPAVLGTAVGRVSGEMGRLLRLLRGQASPWEQLAIGPSQTPLFRQNGEALTRLPPPDAHFRGFLDNLLQLLHLLGYTDEEITQWLGDVATDVEYLLSQLPPRYVMIVEVAAGDILAMVHDGDLDLERLRRDLLIIHDILWPSVVDRS